MADDEIDEFQIMDIATGGVLGTVSALFAAVGMETGHARSSKWLDKEWKEWIEERLDTLGGRVKTLWEERPASEERPTLHDVRNVMVRVSELHGLATGEPHRRLLSNALTNSLSPAFLQTGLTPRMWKVFEQLDYPAMALLLSMAPDRRYPNDLGSQAHLYAKELCDLELVRFDTTPDQTTQYAHLVELGETFQKFISEPGLSGTAAPPTSKP